MQTTFVILDKSVIVDYPMLKWCWVKNNSYHVVGPINVIKILNRDHRVRFVGFTKNSSNQK